MSDQNRIRVFSIDDHPLLNAGCSPYVRLVVTGRHSCHESEEPSDNLEA